MSEIKYELAKNPLFICYATILQEWYKDSRNQTHVTNALEVWFNDFCAAMEIDTKNHQTFLKDAKHNLVQAFWHSMLADVAALPGTDSYKAVEAGMTMVDVKDFKPGI